MLKEIRSKYQAKNYEQVCPKCDRPYMVDSRFLQTVTKDDEDWEVERCPYCGYVHYICI